MSVLTKTALVYGSFFFVLSLLSACAATNGGPIGKAFADLAKGMLIIVASAGIVAFISEGFQRVLGRPRRTRLFTQVSVVAIFAQLVLSGMLLSLVLEHDMMGISYLLLALFMSYIVFTRRKGTQSKEFWMINACCAIVIASSLTITVIISDVYLGTPSNEKAEHFLVIGKVILSSSIFGSGSYLKYRRLERSE